MNTPFLLFQLQKVDTKIQKYHSRLAEIATQLKNDPALSTAMKQFENSRREFQIAEKGVQIIESKIQEKRNKLAQSESSLYGGMIKNPKDLQDLQKEIASIKGVISSLEDEQIELMLILEEKELVHTATDQKYKNAISQNETTNSGLLRESEVISAEKIKLSTERNLLAEQVPSSILQKYDELRAKKGGVAVAQVEDKTCVLCGSSLTPSQCQQAKSPSILFFCPSCNRILYAD